MATAVLFCAPSWAQCGVTMSCGPGLGGDGSDLGIGVNPRSPCVGVCILSDLGRRQFEQQNNCYFSDEYCGGTSPAHRIDRRTQCCGSDPVSGRPSAQQKQISQGNASFNWDNYVRSCPNMRQSEGPPDALWPQCRVGQRHTAGDFWEVQEVEPQPGSANARPYCIDGCSTPPQWVNRLYRTGTFIFNDKDNPTGAGPGGYGSGSSFYQACAVHDRCYQTCNNNSQTTCDNNLLRDMLNVCLTIPANHVTTFTNNLGFDDDENTRSKCESAANNMHTGLQVGGRPAFSIRRQQYCQCC
jgi:hypothetical protein